MAFLDTVGIVRSTAHIRDLSLVHGRRRDAYQLLLD